MLDTVRSRASDHYRISPRLGIGRFSRLTSSATDARAFVNSLWEEAAAQGQTVLVSTGDSGSYDECIGLGVNGLASSPWDVAVGGTDAYFADYATGGASISTFWSSSNDANLGSLQKKFAEQPWNGTQYGMNSITYDPVMYQPDNTRRSRCVLCPR